MTYDAHEAAEAFPLMDAKRLAELRDDIAEHGLLQPIVLLDGRVLDGRNRLRACEDAGVSPRFVEVRNIDDPWAYVWSLNGARRDLTADQRYLIWKECEERSAAMRAELRRIADEANRKRAEAARETAKSQPRAEGGTFAPAPGASTSSAPTRRDDGVRPGREAKAAGAQVNRGTVQRMDQLAASRPDLAEAVKNGEMPAARAIREMKQDAAKAEAKAAVEELAERAADGEELHRVLLGDLRVVGGEIAAGSVDAIITDPPYPREFVPLYRDLAALAARALRPGGSLVVMVGQSYLPDLIAQLGSVDGLRYQWTGAYLTPGGQATQLWDRKVNTFWKPLLWYVKGAYDGPWIGDVTKSSVNDNDKRFHGWGQSESGMLQIVERFSSPGATVLDPFCGAGTTGVVCAASGRRFVGIDLDEQHVQTARGRIAQAMHEVAA